MDDHPTIPVEACVEPRHMRGKIECALVAGLNARDTIGQMAQRVLVAMHEPTPAMAVKGFMADDCTAPMDVWRAMIDEALLGN